MEFVKDESRNAAQLRVLNHLAQQQTLGDKADACVGAGDVFKANPVADFAAKLGLAFPGDARREEPRGQPAWLQDDDLSCSEQAAIKQDLRDLR